MKKEFTICLNCTYCEQEFDTHFAEEWNYVCLAHPRPNPVQPVTGTPYSSPYYPCNLINKLGNCKDFKPGENECNHTQ